jgi:hypothetical protein
LGGGTVGGVEGGTVGGVEGGWPTPGGGGGGDEGGGGGGSPGSDGGVAVTLATLVPARKDRREMISRLVAVARRGRA